MYDEFELRDPLDEETEEVPGKELEADEEEDEEEVVEDEEGL
jgi:hypothetical protein